jgi:putative membrane protein
MLIKASTAMARIFLHNRKIYTIMKKTLIPLAAAVILLASCGNNESSKDSVEKADSANKEKVDSPAAAAEPIKTDEESTSFLVKAANGGMAEVKLAQLAKQKATDTAIQHFADMMIADHGAANEKVKALAAERNVSLPAEPDDAEQKKAADLDKKTGKDFDKEYAAAMVKGHEDTIDLFKKVSAKTSDGAVKAFADNTIPVIEHHLMRIKEIRKGLK